MELTIAIVSAVVSLAGMGLKLWLQNKDVKAAQAETDKWKGLCAAATKENILLREMVRNKEVQLASAKAALASKMSAAELAAALNELFGGKPGAGSDAPAGNPGPKAG